MDTDIVSPTDSNQGRYGKCMALLAGGKRIQDNDLASLGQFPSYWRPPQVLVSEFMAKYKTWWMMISQQKPHPTTFSFSVPPYYPSTARIQDLKPSYLGDLRNGVPHRGSYLIIRALTQPVVVSANVALVVEDEKGFALTLQLFQQPCETIISGTDVFLIKEPLLKIIHPGLQILCIDHVSDIVPLGLTHNLIPKMWYPAVSPLLYKQAGDVAMKRQHYWSAIQSYTSALGLLEVQPDPSQKIPILLSRSQAYLMCRSYEAALADCEDEALNFSSTALYRASQASYSLQRFFNSYFFAHLLCSKYPDNLHSWWKQVVKDRLLEESHGSYDFEHMYGRSKTRTSLNYATFSSPVTIKSSPGRGEGLFTTIDVQAGQLLLCEKAFSFCPVNTTHERIANHFQVDLLINLSTDRMTFGTQTNLVANILSKLSGNPSLIPKFTELDCGNYNPVGITEVDGKPVIDTFLVERIVSLNCFGCPPNSEENLFPTTKNSRQQVHRSTGLWLLGSKINHSCDSNVYRSFIGDFLIVRAQRDITADTELTFWYKEPNGDAIYMKKSLEHWGFECDCVICTEYNETPPPVHEHRGVLLELLRLKTNTLEDTRALLELMDLTYPKPSSEVPRLLLARHYPSIGRLYWYHSKDHCVEMALRALESTGYVIKDGRSPMIPGSIFEVERWGVMSEYALQAWILLCEAYCMRALPAFFKRAVACLKVAYTIAVGEDVTFREAYLRGFDKNCGVRGIDEWIDALELSESDDESGEETSGDESEEGCSCEDCKEETSGDESEEGCSCEDCREEASGDESEEGCSCEDCREEK